MIAATGDEGVRTIYVNMGNLVDGGALQRKHTVTDLPLPPGCEQWQLHGYGIFGIKPLARGGFALLLRCTMEPPDGQLSQFYFCVLAIDAEGVLTGGPAVRGGPTESWIPRRFTVGGDDTIYVISSVIDRISPTRAHTEITRINLFGTTGSWTKRIAHPNAELSITPTSVFVTATAVFATGFVSPIGRPTGRPFVAGYYLAGGSLRMRLEGYHKQGEVWAYPEIVADNANFYLSSYAACTIGNRHQDHLIFKKYDHYGLQE